MNFHIIHSGDFYIIIVAKNFLNAFVLFFCSYLYKNEQQPRYESLYQCIELTSLLLTFAFIVNLRSGKVNIANICMYMILQIGQHIYIYSYIYE